MMKYRSITSPDINNGLGCRITIWISGCSHNCLGCHNPEMHDYKLGNELFAERTVNTVAAELNNKSYIQGITLSGGDPLDQSEKSLTELKFFISQLKSKVYRPFDIWIYSGDVYENLIEDPLKKQILNECDVLVDGPYMKSLRDITLPFRGSLNQRLIDLAETRRKQKLTNFDINVKNA